MVDAQSRSLITLTSLHPSSLVTNNSHFNLSSNSMGSEGARDVGVALKSNSLLKKLVIHMNAFMDEGMEKIALVEKKNYQFD